MLASAGVDSSRLLRFSACVLLSPGQHVHRGEERDAFPLLLQQLPHRPPPRCPVLQLEVLPAVLGALSETALQRPGPKACLSQTEGGQSLACLPLESPGSHLCSCLRYPFVLYRNLSQGPVVSRSCCAAGTSNPIVEQSLVCLPLPSLVLVGAFLLSPIVPASSDSQPVSCSCYLQIRTCIKDIVSMEEALPPLLQPRPYRPPPAAQYYTPA